MKASKAPIEVKKAKVIKAALRCFERDGVEHTTMTDLAAEAGVSRVTLYRMFTDRAALFEAILSQRFIGMIEGLGLHLTRYRNLADALVLGGAYAVQLAQTDQLFHDIVSKGTDHSVEAFILNNTPELRVRNLKVWNPVFLKARKTGELQSALSDDRLIEGVRSILNLMLLRSDLSHVQQRKFLKDFLVPAIIGRVGEA